MLKNSVSYQDSGYFSKLIVDYLDQKSELSPFYNRFPTTENFEEQLIEKQSNFDPQNRVVLVNALKNQYQNCSLSELTKKHIQDLELSNTYTITTGHQLNLFTGPLYFLYKIISTITLCEELRVKYPSKNFVPIYWMATEDHDFEEINYFNFKNVKVKWNKASQGPVGRLSTQGLEEVFEVFSSELGVGANAEYLKNLFRESYLKHNTLAEATRFLANELFKEKGLVIIDGDDASLKRLFVPFVKEELVHQVSFKNVQNTNALLEKEYDIQVNPREINLFYIEDNLRERIIYKDNTYQVNNSKLSFSQEEILKIVEESPEKISPNVILRPLYQEVILPNLCYIGGGGELAYWLQLKENFKQNNITFPILLLRDSVLLSSTKQLEKANKLNISIKELFKNQQILFTDKTKEFSKFTIDFSIRKNILKEQFEYLTSIANQTDKSFFGAVKAQEKKQLNGLESLEKRLLKAEKRVYKEQLERILLLQNELFPNQTLQERKLNFSEFYLENGSNLLDELYLNLNPLDSYFKIIVL